MIIVPTNSTAHLRNRVNWNDYAERIHNTAVSKGFWPEEGRNFGEMICLVHSEITEAYDGAIDGLPDDKLTQYSSFAVEIADALIRLLDTAQSRKIDVNVQLFGMGRHTVGLFTSAEKDLMEVNRSLSNALEAHRKDGDVDYHLLVTIALLLSISAKYALEIQDVIDAKMGYNANRPFKHGKAY